MSIDWSLAGTVILAGIVVVFLALIILIGAVNLMGKIITSIVNKSQPAPQQASAPTSAPAAPVKSAAAPAAAPAAGDDEVIAVISAAVSAYMEETAPGAAYAVTGISPAVNRERSARPVWGFAGMRQNTEPF